MFGLGVDAIRRFMKTLPDAVLRAYIEVSKRCQWIASLLFFPKFFTFLFYLFLVSLAPVDSYRGFNGSNENGARMPKVADPQQIM